MRVQQRRKNAQVAKHLVSYENKVKSRRIYVTFYYQTIYFNRTKPEI